MKKTVFPLVLLSALFLSMACSKSFEVAEDGSESTSPKVFTASIENGTKTTLSNLTVNWNEGDKISVNGAEYTAKTGGGTSTEFIGTGAELVGGKYKAYYPSDIFNGTVSVMPAIQYYGASSDISKVSPMYAESSSTALSFKNIFALLKITVPSTKIVTSIEVSSDKVMVGEFSVGSNFDVVMEDTPTADNKKVTLNCGPDGVAGTDFYVAIPPQTYGNIDITINTPIGQLTKQTVASSITILRNKIYSLEIDQDYEYLCFTAREDNVSIGMKQYAMLGYMELTPQVKTMYGVTFDFPSLLYSYNGALWTEFDAADPVELVNTGDYVYFKANNPNAALGTTVKIQSNDVPLNNAFTATGNVDVSGNIMYLLDGTTPPTTLTAPCAFTGLFCNMSKLINAKDLKLPLETLSIYCYASMFSSCTSLETSPELPANTLAPACYANMFANCTNLVTPPSLSSQNLAEMCYMYMFQESGITSAPALPAQTLVASCYYGMFDGCASLEAAPTILPATALEEECYAWMFSNCTKIQSTPELPATTIKKESCYHMFDGCTELVNVPSELKVAVMADHAYDGLFEDCSKLTTIPDLGVTTLAKGCFQNMFENCTSLNTYPDLTSFTTLYENCYCSMFMGCESLTTAPALPSTDIKESCYSQMFDGCTSLQTAPDLPGTVMDKYCYSGMFRNCTSLVTPPTISAVTLEYESFKNMFEGCTALVNAPSLANVTTLGQYCCRQMFKGCTALVNAPSLTVTSLQPYCYAEMFEGCTALVDAPSLNAATLQDHCYWKMFSGCSKLTNVSISATNIVADKCLTDWLKDAGTSSSGTPTVSVANSSMVDPIKSTLNTTIWTVTAPTEPQ